MKIAISTALVLGMVQYAAAFPCYWNGAGSSYVYHDVNTDYTCGYNCGGGDCDRYCLSDVDNRYAQTTCCRCASKGQCEQVPPSFTNGDGNTGADLYSWQGCDLYAPDVFIGDAVESASAPGMWFTSKNQLEAFLEATVTCTDDCSLEPTCVKTVEYPANGQCEAYVTVLSQDRNSYGGACANVNTESKSFYVRYDETAPTATVTLGNYMDKKSADGRKYEDIPLEITVTENCDPNPEITITVFSDEVTVTHEFDDKPAAVLERKYSNTGANGVLQGWGLTLDRYSYARKLCGPHMECYEADGRFYIVRVCVKDLAGLWSCTEKSVGVPLKPTELKHITPENQGKLFIVAEDAGFWNAAPNEIPFRNENTYLNVPPSEYQQARLCWANYRIARTLPTAQANINTNDECWRKCGTTTGCIGYEYNYNANECYLVIDQTDPISMGDLYLVANTMPEIFTGWNIYAMSDVVCPDKNEPYRFAN